MNNTKYDECFECGRRFKGNDPHLHKEMSKFCDCNGRRHLFVRYPYKIINRPEYAHSVKNTATIHYKQLYYGYLDKDMGVATYGYLCNYQFYTSSKSSDDILEVTCKNCIREYKKIRNQLADLVI